MLSIHIHTIRTQGHHGNRNFAQDKYILKGFKGIFTSFFLSLVKFHHKLHFQTAGILLFLIKILRYFTDTQTGIPTATISILRQLI